jgi:hypothetical protein
MALPPLCSSPCSVSAGHSWLRWRQKQCPDYSCSRPGHWLCWLWRQPKLSVRGRGTKRLLILAKALDYAKKGLGAVLTHIPAASDLSASGATALSVAIVALVCFLAGLVARTVTAQPVVDALESSVLSKIPAYEVFEAIVCSACGGDKFGRIGADEREVLELPPTKPVVLISGATSVPLARSSSPESPAAIPGALKFARLAPASR